MFVGVGGCGWVRLGDGWSGSVWVRVGGCGYVLVGGCVDTCAHMSSKASHVKTEDCSSIVTLLMTPPAALLKVFYPTDIFLLWIIFRIKARHVTT